VAPESRRRDTSDTKSTASDAKGRDPLPGGIMSSQFEMFECAAECERLMDAASDPLKKQTLEKLRDV
jgi:hypothetical protein